MLLGEVVTELMKRDGLTFRDVATRVRDAGAKNVRYQHIQQLVANPGRHPRYVVELARSWGMSVEQLKNWRNRAPGTPVVRPPSHGMGLDRAILGAAVSLLNDLVKALGGSLPNDEYAEFLAEIYELLQSDEKAVPSKVVEITAYLANRARKGDSGDEPRSGSVSRRAASG